MPRKLTSPTGRAIPLKPIRANAGLEARYRVILERAIGAMSRDTNRQVLACYRANPPEMAIDISPAAALRATLRRLAQKWNSRFRLLADSLAGEFAADSVRMTDRAFAAVLKKAGFTVGFRMTREVNDITQAAVTENVTLIRSISSEYFTQIDGIVMRGVQAGRDLGTVSTELQHQFGVTDRRAALIARDQNNKATAAITRARQTELGITQAIWRHSAGGKVPRPTHVKNNGNPFDIREGWLDPALNKRIWPGTEINCGCVSQSVIPGLATLSQFDNSALVRRRAA